MPTAKLPHLNTHTHRVTETTSELIDYETDEPINVMRNARRIALWAFTAWAALIGAAYLAWPA